MIAKFFLFDEVSDVPLAPSGAAMPTGSAFLAAGNYSYGGVNWDMTRPGLYRFLFPNGVMFNRVVYGSPLDLYELFSAMSWNHVHGTDDNHSDYQVSCNNGRYRHWRMQCGFVAGLCAWLMPQFGVSTRVVNAVTLATKNGFDDGHIVFETYHSGAWRMWDLTNGVYFRDSNGVHLSTAAFIAQIAGGGAFPEVVSLSDGHKINSQTAGTIDLLAYWQMLLRRPDQREAWYRRIFQSIV